MNWLLLKNSLLVGGLTTLTATAFGVAAAFWVAGLPHRWRTSVIALGAIALALPPFLATNCWLDLLGAAGAWRHWLPLNIMSLGGTVWILALLTWPITLLLLLGAWQRLEPAQLESDLAVRGLWLIRALLWPLGRGALAQAAVLTFVLAINNFAVPAILQVKVFPAEMWVRFNTTFDTWGALQSSWPLVLPPLLLLAWCSRREIPWPTRTGSISPRLFRQQLGKRWLWSCGLFTALLCLLSVGLPLFQLIATRRTWTELPGAVAAGQSDIVNSGLLSALAATAVLLWSFLFSTPARSWQLKSLTQTLGLILAKAGRLFSWLLFLLPGVLVGMALILVFNRPWLSLLYQGVGILLLAFAIRYLALGWTVVSQSLQTLDRDLWDVARLEGATRWQMFRHVAWPQVAPRAAAAWYIVFLLCLWDVESIILIVPPGGETLALRIFNLLHYGHNSQVNALCLTLLALAVSPLLIWQIQRFARRAWKQLPASAARVPTLGLLSASLFLTGCNPDSGSSSTKLRNRIFHSVQIIGSRGVGVGQFNKPRSVAVDAQDNLYVADVTGRIQKFSSNGVFLLSWQMPQTDLGKPKGMCRDRAGNILVLEPHYQRVNVFSPAGNLLHQWGQKGTNAGAFELPRAVAVTSNGDVWVSEYSILDRVQRFSGHDGKYLRGFGHSGTGTGELNRPEGLGIDKQDRLYVADSCNHRVQVFNPDGQLARAYGKAGTSKGELSYPYDLCVDEEGRQYVCEFGNSRIQVFDAQDQPLEIIGGPGAEPGQFSNPWGVALDSAGNLYVADSQNHRVQKLIR